MKKIITVGSAMHDIFLQRAGSDSIALTQNDTISQFHIFSSGEKTEIDDLIHRTGGGATNTAVSFQRLGHKSFCVALIGNDESGKLIRNELEEESVCTDYMSVIPTIPTGKSPILHTHLLERAILVHRGANVRMTQEHIKNILFSDFDAIYITSLHGASAKVLHYITTQARKKDSLIALNPGSRQLKEETESIVNALRSIDILIMNTCEAKFFMQSLIEREKKCHNIFHDTTLQEQCALEQPFQTPYLLEHSIRHENYTFSIKKFFAHMLQLGPSIVIVTNGKNGVYIGTKNEIFFHPSLQIDVVDTVGAGDSFGSTFVAQVLKGKGIEDALRHGIIQSASVIQQIGSKQGLLSQKELDERSRNIDRKLLYRCNV